MAYSLMLTAFQGDFAGATVDRQPNEIYLSACHTEWGSPVSPLFPVEISVGPLTPGAAANGVVLGVLPGPVPGSYRIAVGQWDDGSPAWNDGVHVFAVQVRASVSWPFGTGSTLATVVVKDSVRVPIPTPDPFNPFATTGSGGSGGT
jgi:hypothetical protein